MSSHENMSFNPNSYISSAKTNRTKGKKYHKSGTQIGAHIVNAETGQMTDYKVGSVDEDRFFTIMINEGKEGVKLFYNSPEQYESHRNTSVDDNVKIEWHNREHERRVREFSTTSNDDSGGDVVVK